MNGGRFTPPRTARVGLYESTDGGASFVPAFLPTPQDSVNPANPTGGDFFRGGASDVELYRSSNETHVYAAFFDYGVYRRSVTLDGDTAFHQIFNSAGGGTAANSSSLADRVFARAERSPAYGSTSATPAAAPPRISSASTTRMWPAGLLVDRRYERRLDEAVELRERHPGFASRNYCATQCSYDMPVYSPPGAPDVVYIGGAMQYSEIGGRSNGRAVQRSEDAGVNFTDMTIDRQGVSLHPDQHVIAATPLEPDVVFIGNDGGVWRLNGSFADLSGDCAARPVTGNNLIDCTDWLSKVPATISAINGGLGTLQYQSLSISAQDPLNQIMGGTQDNGTHAFFSKSGGTGKGNSNWFVTIFGDGGQSGHQPVERQQTLPHVLRRANRHELPRRRRTRMELGVGYVLRAVGRRPVRRPLLLHPGRLRSHSRRKRVHRPAARVAHAGRQRRPGVPRSELQRVLRNLRRPPAATGLRSGRIWQARDSGPTRPRAPAGYIVAVERAAGDRRNALGRAESRTRLRDVQRGQSERRRGHVLSHRLSGDARRGS